MQIVKRISSFDGLSVCDTFDPPGPDDDSQQHQRPAAPGAGTGTGVQAPPPGPNMPDLPEWLHVNSFDVHNAFGE